MNSVQSETWSRAVSWIEVDRIQMAGKVQSIHQYSQNEGLRDVGFLLESLFLSENGVLFVVNPSLI